MIALLTITSASAGGFLQVGTGQRMLDMGATSLLTGGGLRLGYDLGPVVPFVGGSLLLGDVADAEDDEYALKGTTWNATAGLRVDLAGEDGVAQAFLSGGASFGRNVGAYEYVEFDEAYRVTVGAGPGAFVGAGADAFLSERLALGLEVGGAWTSGSFEAEYVYQSQVEDSIAYDEISAFYTWADLHLVFRFGRAS